MLGIKDMFCINEDQLLTDKDDRKLGHILGYMWIIIFLVLAGIKMYTNCKIILSVHGNINIKLGKNSYTNSLDAHTSDK